jgi:hypothetical protein
MNCPGVSFQYMWNPENIRIQMKPGLFRPAIHEQVIAP